MSLFGKKKDSLYLHEGKAAEQMQKKQQQNVKGKLSLSPLN